MNPKKSDLVPTRPLRAVLAIILATLAIGGCTITTEQPGASQRDAFASRQQLDAAVTETLERLYRLAPGSREMAASAAGVLVFPQVIGGAIIVGGEHGRGALRIAGRSADYYSTTGASVGWQIGGQSKAVVYIFSSREALQRFRASNGWTVGVDATVALGRVGANGSVDSQTAQQPVVSFVMNNVGLEVGASMTGARIYRTAP